MKKGSKAVVKKKKSGPSVEEFAMTVHSSTCICMKFSFTKRQYGVG